MPAKLVLQSLNYIWRAHTYSWTRNISISPRHLLELALSNPPANADSKSILRVQLCSCVWRNIFYCSITSVSPPYTIFSFQPLYFEKFHKYILIKFTFSFIIVVIIYIPFIWSCRIFATCCSGFCRFVSTFRICGNACIAYNVIIYG